MTVLLSKNPVPILKKKKYQWNIRLVTMLVRIRISADLLPMCVCVLGMGGGSSTKDTYTSTLGGPVPCSSSGVNKRWLLVPVNKAQSAFLGLDLYIGSLQGTFLQWTWASAMQI